MSAGTAVATSLAVGIDIGGTKVKVCAADVSGRILAIREIPSGPDRDARDLLHDVKACVDLVVERATDQGTAAVTVSAVGIVTPGVIGADGMGLAPNNPGMATSVPADAIGKLLGLDRVAWANDVKAAALAESVWGELRGAKCGLYVNVGTGLSAGAVIGGIPLEGAHGAALEIGYLLPSSGYVPGHRSGAAPLEDLISGRALSDRARAMLGEHVSASQVLEVLNDTAGAGPRATALRRLAREFVDQWCRAVTNLAIALDPDVISVGGGVSSASTVFLPPLRAALDEYVPYPPRLVVSRTPNDLSMLGALLLAYRSLGVEVPAVSLPADRERAEARAVPATVA